MTKKEFAELERICKKEWTRLAETGDGYKSYSLDVFVFNCPACEIAKRVGRYRETRCGFDSNREPVGSHCAYCPIDLFREWNRVDSSGSVGYGCEYHPHSPYAMWCGARLDSPAHRLGSSTGRKIAAHAMTKLNWTYLPIYEFI